MRYNVLWIDDEYKAQDDFIGFAEQYGIDIVPHESHEEGMLDLRKRLDYFHAVILDAKVKEYKSDTTTGVEGLRASRDAIIQINSTHYLPDFIFTGQPAYQDDKMFLGAFGKFYVKGKDNERLLQDLIAKCEEKPEMQARKKFPGVFPAFDKGILPGKHIRILLHIISCLENQDYRKINLNAQRDLLEVIFMALNNPIPCIPDDFYDPRKDNKPIQERCTMFLEDRSVNVPGKSFKLNKDISKIIKGAFRSVKETTNELSHLSNEAVLKNEFIATSYLLFQILEWLPEFVETNYKEYI